MEEQRIIFETAKLAKEKGFNEECDFNIWGDGKYSKLLHRKNESFTTIRCSAPTQALLQKWLRDVHKIFIETAHSDTDLNHYTSHVYMTWEQYCSKIAKSINGESIHFKTYEEALEEALFQALNLIK